MNWFLLIIAGLFEVGFTSCLGKIKDTTGTERMLWIIPFCVCLIASGTLVWKAVETLPIGTAYAVWTGIGAAGTVLLGIFVFNEPASFARLFFIGLLIFSIIGLKMASH